jgi:streptogramin lyase
MDSTGNRTIHRQRFVKTSVIAYMILCWCLSSSAQQKIVRCTIKGTVTADQGQVIGLRVAAHNLDQKLWYTVFTVKGEYTVPQALPGRYQIMVYEPAYDSPKLPVQLAPGETKTVDIELKQRGHEANSNAGGDEGPRQSRNSSSKIVYVNSLNEMFPAGPALALLKENCTGCHAPNGWSSMHYTKEGFLRGIERMTETGPANQDYVLALGRTVFDRSQKEMLADYLVKNFGPGMPEKRLRVDPLSLDEDVTSKAIYVSYDVPEDLEMQPDQGNWIGANMVDGVIPQTPGLKVHHLQAPIISPLDGSIWFSSRVSNSVIRLDPKQQDPAKRWKNYPIKGSNHWVAVSGMAIDSKGHVYWSELQGGMLGELDPETGKQIRYDMPQKGCDVGVVIDKDDNIGFALIWGSQFGRIEAKTRRLHMYPTPTNDNGIYGLAADREGNLWGAGWQKGTISKWDVKTESVKEYKVPGSWGQIRRIGVDSKGMVWGSEYITGQLAKLDPSTSEISEYKIPVSGASPYEAWADKSDNIWTADQVHSAMIKLDQKTGKFVYYGMPQPHQSVPKIEVEGNNTIWFGTRGELIVTGVHFYPNGYTAEAPPEP